MPVVGTVCFILCGFAPFSILNKALTWKPMVYIGPLAGLFYHLRASEAASPIASTCASSEGSQGEKLSSGGTFRCSPYVAG